MLLFKGHPESIGKTKRKYKVVSSDSKKEMLNTIQNSMNGYKGYKMRGKEITALVMDAVHIDALVTLMNNKRILVMTSFEDKDYQMYTDANFKPTRHAGDHMYPVVHHFAGSDSKLWVSSIEGGDSIYTKLYDDLGISKVRVNEFYSLGGNLKIKPPANVKFDTVVLLGNKSSKLGKFNPQQIKEQFQPYCKEDFDLIDIYRYDDNLDFGANNRRMLVGEGKDISGLRHGYKNMLGLQTWDFKESIYLRARMNLNWSSYMRVF